MINFACNFSKQFYNEVLRVKLQYVTYSLSFISYFGIFMLQFAFKFCLFRLTFEHNLILCVLNLLLEYFSGYELNLVIRIVNNVFFMNLCIFLETALKILTLSNYN